jgi:hypothetical protein
MQTVASRFYAVPVGVLSTITITGVVCNVSANGTTGAQLRVAIYNINSTGKPTTLVTDLGLLSVATIGNKSITGLSVALSPGPYVLMFGSDASATQPSYYTGIGTPYWGANTNDSGNMFRVSMQQNLAAWTFGTAPASAPTITTTNANTPVGWGYPIALTWTVP